MLWKGSVGDKKLQEVLMDGRRGVLAKMEVKFERPAAERGVKSGVWGLGDRGLEEIRKGGKNE